MTKAYVSLSGGADSTAVALLLWQQGVRFELLFSDTGWELPETYHILPQIARYTGKRLNVVANGTGFQHLANFGFFLPSMMNRWCTRLLKQVPQDSFYEKAAPEVVYVGIRADETERTRLATRPHKGDYRFEFPLVDAGLDRKAVHALCTKHGLLSPAYQWRTNTSCYCCPFQRKADWLGLMRTHPDLYALAEEWERQSVGFCGYTWAHGRSLEKMRRLTEQQLDLLPECDEEACTICRW